MLCLGGITDEARVVSRNQSMKGHVNHVNQFRFLIENKRELLMGFLVQE